MKHGDEFNPYKQFYGLFIPNSIAMQPALLDSHKLLLGRLMQFAGQNGKAYPTIKRLAIELAWKPQKVQRNIKNLKDLGLLNVNRLEPDNAISPNIYTFPYSPLYDDIANITEDTRSATENNGASVPGITDDTTPVTRMIPHIIESEIIESDIKGISKEIRRTSSHATKEQKPLEYNGDEGDEGIEKEKVMPKKLKKIKIVSKPKKIANPYNYCPDVLKIVTHWQDLGGKSHKNGNAKQGPKKIQSMIDELLILGRNPYIRVVDDPEIKTRQWTINEIISSINVYAKIKHKPIDKMYLNEFILFSYNGKNTRKLSDHSPLVESFEDIPNETTSKWKDKIKNKLKDLYPKEYIYDKVLLDCAAFLESNHKIYEVTSNGASYNYHILNVFIAYVRRIVTEKGSPDPLKYISGSIFLADFIKYSTKKSFLLKKRKKQLA